MKIKALKSGRFAHPHPDLPQLVLRRGAEYEVDQEMGVEIVMGEWGEVIQDFPNFSRMTKKELEAFSHTRGFDVDTDKTKAEIIAEIENEIAHG